MFLFSFLQFKSVHKILLQHSFLIFHFFVDFILCNLLSFSSVQDNFNNKRIDINRRRMRTINVVNTPAKQGHFNSKILVTADTPQENSSIEAEIKVDYKAKTFKLMKELAESEVVNKKSTAQIRHLQKQLNQTKQELQKIYSALGSSNFEEAQKKIHQLSTTSSTEINVAKIEQWSNLIEEYKRIINAQQYKFLRQEQQLKILDMKLKRYEQQSTKPAQEIALKSSDLNSELEQELSKIKGSLQQKDKEIVSLNEQLSMLKNEYKQLLVDKQKWKDQYIEIQNKYNLQIEHFQSMQRHVEQRLIEVEREMNFYRQQRETHLQKIDRLKKEIQLNENKKFFSFGGVKQQEAQTDFQEDSSPYNYECLQISIKTLLEENAKLKNTLVTLYTKRGDESLPKEVELEMQILLNMNESCSKISKAQNFEIEKYFQSEKRQKSKDQWNEEKLWEVKEEEEEQKSENIGKIIEFTDKTAQEEMLQAEEKKQNQTMNQTSELTSATE